MNGAIGFDEAVALLPKRKKVHTYRNPAVAILVGADWEKGKIVEALRAASEIVVTGEAAQSMRHGLAICDDQGLLFIETGQ